uniref:LAGLIDADG endonuclease n1 TaxGibberella zeae PH-1 RepIDA5J034_GIBZE n=1 Tax=Fusarium pseudograminearum CS5834 TaxID=1318459 RepID=W1IB45_FUSPS
MSGWINYSGIVTSQKMSENKMGNRGSKSVIHETKQSCIIVKEQRVNGSWCGINIPHLRYTLLGFGRSYQVKTLSNQIIQRQFYSSESNLDNSQLRQDPWFISGFSDAEGCFMVLVRKSPKSKLGWQIEANFTINLHVRDLDLLKLIQSFSFASHYFGVGRIGKERNGCRDFTIGSLDQIITKVIPHFDKYPLKTNKYSDYLLFKQVVMMMQRGEHLTAEGLQKIIGIRASLNRGLTPLLLEAFPNTVALVRPLLPPLKNVKLDPQWVAGFTSGDGCFKVSIRESKLHKRGSRVVLLFVVTQHIRDELLLKSLVDFFGCVGEASKLILIKIILSSDVNHSKIIMKRFYLFSINTLSLALNLRISKIELK